MIVNKSMFPMQTGFSVLNTMQGRMSELQMQLGTGQKSQTLAGMGSDLPISLSARSRLAQVESYMANIGTVNLRLDFLDNAFTRFDEIEGETRNSVVPGQYGNGHINLATLPGQSRARLDEVVTLLNSDVAGRFLFGGSKTESAPLPDTSVLLEGQGGRAGFRTVVGERKQADMGAGTGRLNAERVDTTVSLFEDGDHPFGFKLSALSTSSGGISTSGPTGDPAGLSVTFDDQPIAGQTVTIGVTLPDGTETQFTMTAVDKLPPEVADPDPAADQPSNVDPGLFMIGADPAETAENFHAALEKTLTYHTERTLSAASTYAAAENFFNAAGEPVLRVDGGDPATATGLRLANPVGEKPDTVIWYRGDTTDDPARTSVGAKVDESTRVAYGVRANETGLLRMVRTLAANSIETYPPDDETGRGRFDAMTTRQQRQMSEAHNSEPGSVERITMDLVMARSAAGNAKDRHTDYKAQLENILSEAETVRNEEVVAEILALQTRLQASYQVTSMVSQLSLSKFI